VTFSSFQVNHQARYDNYNFFFVIKINAENIGGGERIVIHLKNERGLSSLSGLSLGHLAYGSGPPFVS
jgi:hypothetical protein